jgi:hypothetical protein
MHKVRIGPEGNSCMLEVVKKDKSSDLEEKKEFGE